MSGKKSNLSVYAIVSQLAFMIVGPLLLFLVGGRYAVEYYQWDDSVMVVFVILGIVFMIGGGVSYIGKLVRLYGKEDKSKYHRAYSDPRDNDYYDEYKDMRK